MIRRSAVRVVLLSTFLFGLAVPLALAKMPPFEIDVTSEDGGILISVRVLGFQESTVPPDGFDPADLDGLLAVYPTSDLDDRGRPTTHLRAVPVDLKWSGDPGVYEGRVPLEEPGTRAVVPFPTVRGFDPQSPLHEEYPATLYVEASASPEPATVLAVVVGGGVLLTAGTIIFLRRGRGGSGSGKSVQRSMPGAS
jgi:hypothetical protein